MVNSAGIAVLNEPLYVASGFSITFDIQFGQLTAAPADGFSLVFFETASALTIPSYNCGTSRGGNQCFSATNPRFTLTSITYNGGATSNCA